MFQIRFNDIIFSSNRKKISNSKIVLFFYGLGCSSTDLSFLLKQTTKDTQILIAELPGHNNLTFSQIDILSYSSFVFVSHIIYIFSFVWLIDKENNNPINSRKQSYVQIVENEEGLFLFSVNELIFNINKIIYLNINNFIFDNNNILLLIIFK